MKLPLILAGDIQGSVTYVVTPFTTQGQGGSTATGETVVSVESSGKNSRYNKDFYVLKCELLEQLPSVSGPSQN